MKWLYKCLFNSDINLGFDVPHLDTSKCCDKKYMQLILAKMKAARAAAISLPAYKA
jgi:hypothetical protein